MPVHPSTLWPGNTARCSMLCSHARSQPACFSGRTLPSAAQQYHRRQDSAARAASWAFASTGADTATAGIAGAAQRGQIHEFDKLPSFSRAHSSSEESLVAYKQGPSGPRGRSYKKVEQRAPERIHKQENGARWDTAAGSETAQLVLEQTLQVRTWWTAAVRIPLAFNGAGD